MKSVLAFQEQQERALLALHGSSSQGYKHAGGFDKITENSVSKTGIKSIWGSLSQKSVVTNAFVPLKRILNIEVIISPVFQQQGAHYVDWPSALLANFSEKFADLGNLEAYGTLWKLVERADFPGVNKKFIHFETAEIGENNIFYLTKILELSDKRADAAIWEINVVENTNNHVLESTLLGTFKPRDNTLKTLAIQCKLVYMDNANEIDNAHDSIYLASMITDNGIKGITVLNLKETNPNYRYAISWDIISETTGSTLSSDGLPVEDEFA